MLLPELRKVVTYDEEIYLEGERPAEPPLRLIGVAAIVRNPWAGRGYVADLQPEIQRMAPVLGSLLTDRLVALAGSGAAIEAYGKASMVGTSGELEHCSALIHTLRFGNFYREAVGAKIPLMDKHDSGRRSHYLTVQFAVPDAPGHDEILVALGASTGGRPHHRIGDRYSDLAAIGRSVENPAGV